MLRRYASGLVVLPMGSLAVLCKEKWSAKMLSQHNESDYSATHHIAVPYSLALGALGQFRLTVIRCDLATVIAAARRQHIDIAQDNISTGLGSWKLRGTPGL